MSTTEERLAALEAKVFGGVLEASYARGLSKSEFEDYQKSVETNKKKLIDKSKLPVGTMTNFGRLMEARVDVYPFRSFIYSKGRAHSVETKNLRIVPMTKWEVLQEGDVIPDGVTSERVYGFEITDSPVVVFRITGIHPDYIDNESEAA